MLFPPLLFVLPLLVEPLLAEPLLLEVSVPEAAPEVPEPLGDAELPAPMLPELPLLLGLLLLGELWSDGVVALPAAPLLLLGVWPACGSVLEGVWLLLGVCELDPLD